MNIILNQAELTPPMSEWRDSESYSWITTLPRRAIAWEFLRRSPRYRDSYVTQRGAVGAARTDWPMVRLRRSDIGRTPSSARLEQDGL
jgi:hypothetical protein